MLDVKFTPASVGAQAADITVASNDPNEPSQTIHVTGNGVQVPTPPAAEPPPDDQPIERGETGCGCRAAPTGGEVAPYALLGIVALAARRRRR